MKDKILLLFSASLFSFFNLMLFSLMNVLGVYLAKDFSYTTTQVGQMASWDLVGNIAGFIPIGLLLDRIPVRRIGLTLLGVAIVATMLMAITSNYKIFCLLRFLQGLASAGSLLITMRLGSSVFRDRANTTIGVMIFIALCGGIFGNTGFSFIAKLFGWQTGLMMIACIGIPIFILMAYSFNKINLISSHHRPMKFFINRYQILAGIELALLNAPVFILGSVFGNQYLMEKTAASLEATSRLSSLIFLGIMLASPILGYAADKFGNFILIITGLFILLSCSIILSLDHTYSYHIYFIIFILLGAGCSTQNLIYPLLYRYSPEHPSINMATASLVFNAMGALLQNATGVASTWYQGFNIISFMLIIIFTTGLVLLPFCKIKQASMKY